MRVPQLKVSEQHSTKVDLRRAKVAGRGTVEVCAATDRFRAPVKGNHEQKFTNQGEEDEKEVVSHKQCNRYLSMA